MQQQEKWSDSGGDLLVVAKVPPSLADRDRPLFRYGDRLIVSGRVEEPPAFEDFDYRDYLARQGVFSTMIHPGVELVGEGEGSRLMRGVLSLRNRLSGSLERALPEPQNAMAQALLLGRRSAMPTELTRAFRDAGASHILAISGLHVGVLLGISVAVSRWLLGARRQLYLLLPLLSIWGYAALSGMSPSVQRAAVMGSVYLLGVALGRQNSVAPRPCRGRRGHDRPAAFPALRRLLSTQLRGDDRPCAAGRAHRENVDRESAPAPATRSGPRARWRPP